jgi:integrase
MQNRKLPQRLVRNAGVFYVCHHLSQMGWNATPSTRYSSGPNVVIDIVFATAKGTPLDAQNVVNRHFKPLLRWAGLPDIRWHDLRHSCFTLLLSRGVHPKFVQHLAGHASIQLTLDRYSHWMPTMGKHTASAMDKALDEADREDAPKDKKGALDR